MGSDRPAYTHTSPHTSADTPVEAVACCTFCLKPHTKVKALVAGPALFICDGCVDLCSQLVGDRLVGRISVAPRLLPWEQTDSLDLALANLPNVGRARAQVESSLVGWVRRARTLGATWAQIGDSLGITRQSAWERFAPEESRPSGRRVGRPPER